MMTIPEWCPPRTTETFTALQVIYDAYAERYKYLFNGATTLTLPERPVHMYNMIEWRQKLANSLLYMLTYALDLRNMGNFFDISVVDKPDAAEICQHYGIDANFLKLATESVRGRLLNDWEWLAQISAVLNNLIVSRNTGGLLEYDHFWEKVYQDGGEKDNDGTLLNSTSGIHPSDLKTYAQYKTATAFWERDSKYDNGWGTYYIKRHNYDRFLRNSNAGQFVGKWSFRYTNARVSQWAHDDEEWFDVSKYIWHESIPDITVNGFDDESEVFNIPSQYKSNVEEILALPQSYAEWNVNKPAYDEIYLYFSGTRQICLNWENLPAPDFKYFDREAFNKTHNL